MIQVAVAVLEDGGKFLLGEKVHRPGNTLSQSWHFPGGKADAGENIYQTLRREVFEETNLRVVAKKLLGKTETKEFQMWYFLCCAEDGTFDDLRACDDLESVQMTAAHQVFLLCPQHVQAEWPKGVKDYIAAFVA